MIADHADRKMSAIDRADLLLPLSLRPQSILVVRHLLLPLPTTRFHWCEPTHRRTSRLGV